MSLLLCGGWRDKSSNLLPCSHVEVVRYVSLSRTYIRSYTSCYTQKPQLVNQQTIINTRTATTTAVPRTISYEWCVSNVHTIRSMVAASDIWWMVANNVCVCFGVEVRLVARRENERTIYHSIHVTVKDIGPTTVGVARLKRTYKYVHIHIIRIVGEGLQ